MDNIYVNYGQVITNRYISRNILEKRITDKLINNSDVSSVGLTGLHKIGKTTLLENVLLPTFPTTHNETGISTPILV